MVECVLGSFGSVGGKWDVKDMISGTQLRTLFRKRGGEKKFLKAMH
jgi:hypothetical protein